MTGHQSRPVRQLRLVYSSRTCAAVSANHCLDENTSQLVLGQCVTVADCIANGRSAAWLAVRITAAMLVAFLPGRPWKGHLELIWKLEADDGVNCSALRSAARRFRRTSVTSTPEADS